METFKWLFNLIILNLYLLCLYSIQTIGENISPEEIDLLYDLKLQEKLLLSKIDPSIRHHLRKVGISITQNSYSGFDTEFKNSSLTKNTLVSAQLAITSKITVKVPKQSSYTFSTVDVELNKLYKLKAISEVFNYPKIEASIQWSIQTIRQISLANYDESMLIITESLKIVRGLKYYESEEYTIFSLPPSRIQPYIFIGKTISLSQMVKTTATISTEYIDKCTKIILALLKDICSKPFTIQNGKCSLIEEIYKSYNSYNQIELLTLDSLKQLPYIIHPSKVKPNIEAEPEPETEKRLTREFKSDLFPSGQKVCITYTKFSYFIAHLTQADLSILNDFDSIKEDLSIVNGSFVTLRDPLKYCGNRIHIRDTMLLAPAGSKSLAQIGKLYGEGYLKINITPDEISDMQTFSKLNQEKFIEYALRDALISLIHALWMEDFNFNLGGVGIPLSLSSVGRKYVKSV
jgi:hypothetical protein